MSSKRFLVATQCSFARIATLRRVAGSVRGKQGYRYYIFVAVAAPNLCARETRGLRPQGMNASRQSWQQIGSHLQLGNKALRVLHVIESLPPAGAEQALVNLVPCLKSYGINTEVAVLWPPYDLADGLRLGQIRVHELDIASQWSVRDGIPKLWRLIRNNNFDLIHAHLPMAVFYSALSRGAVPLVATLHGLSFELYPAITPARKMRRYAERWWTNHRVNAFTAVSSSVAEHYHKILKIPLDRIQIIPNGFPVAALTRDPCLNTDPVRERYGVAPSDFFVVHAGRFIPQKGHVYMLQALSQLRKQGAQFRALFLGGGPLRTRIESIIAEQGLANHVRLHPPVSQMELRQVLQAADLFVFPSISEGFGMAAGEAMCLGVPVIASDLPGIASLIESGVSGLLVPPADAESLLGAIWRTMTDSGLRTQIADGGSQRIRAYFSCEMVAARIASVYRTTLYAPITAGW